MSDESLAQKLSEVLNISFEELYLEKRQEDDKRTAMLICMDTAKEVYPQLKTEYFVERKDMFDLYGFKDCVSVELHTFSNEIT